MIRATLLFVLLCGLTNGCTQRPQIHQHQLLTFGTLVEITIATQDKSLAERAFQQLEKDFARMNRDWNGWKPGGELYRINQRLSQGKPVTTTPELIRMLTQARQISRDSHYLFNPAIGKLIALWGFHNDQPAPNPNKDARTLREQTAARPRLDDLRIDGNTVQSTNPGVNIDLGGFAKGYALKLEARKLLTMGLKDFIINAGGDLIAYGRHIDRNWRIGIRDPDGGRALASIEAQNGESIFTSGDYERYYLENGKRRHHIIDPRSGQPSESAHAVTVITRDPALADAAATALMIALPDEWRQIAQRLGIDKVLRLEANGELSMTPAMAQRVQILRQVPNPQRPPPTQPDENFRLGNP